MRRKNYIILLLVALFCSFNAAEAQSITVEAETYTAASAGSTPIVKENAGASVGYFDENGEMLTYNINIVSAGYYQLSFLYNAGANGTVMVKTATSAQGLVSYTGQTYAGGWWLMPIANWPTTDITKSPLFYLEAGAQNLYLINKGVGLNIDKFTLTKSTNQNVTITKIMVTPSSVYVKPNRKATLTAKAVTSTGIEVAAPITWSSNAPGGVYTSGATIKIDEVTVTSGSIITKVRVNVKMPSKNRNFMVTKHGQLHTSGKGLANKDNQMTSFAGPSWAWSCSTPKYWTADAVRYFVEDWKAGIIRLPMSIAPDLYSNQGTYNGKTWNKDNYFYSPEYAMGMMETMIDAAIENDIYVVVDFHEHWAAKDDIKAKAKTFFADISKLYGSYPNIIYEIFNEPRDNTSNSEVTAYANEIIPIIRANDPDNVIVIGSTWFSQQPDGVNPSGTNLAYTLHYYANQHGTSLVSKLDCGRPIMVTECGADGGSQWDYINKCKANGISHMTWEVNNKQIDGDEAWSIFPSNDNPDATTWTDASLTGPGKNQKEIVIGWPRAVEPGVWTPPCDDTVLSSIKIVAQKTTLALDEAETLTVTGESSCQPLTVPNVEWSPNAPGGVFKKSKKGVYKVTAKSGTLTSEILIKVSNDIPAITTFKVEAESYTAETTVVNGQYDKVLQKENGGLSIGYYNDNGETVTYSVNVPIAGEYDVVLKYCAAGAGTLGIKAGSGAEQTINFGASTGSPWYGLAFASWPSSEVSKVTLPAGTQTLTVINKGVAINLDYLEFTIKGTPDAVAPTIALLGESTITVYKDTPYVDAGANAIDPEDGDINDLMVTVNPVNIKAEGIYEVTYNVSDLAGNKATQVTRKVTVLKPSSLNSIDESKLKLYPNPSNGQFTIDADATYTLEVFDVLGIKVHSQVIEPATNNVNIGSQKGLYLVKIFNNENSYVTRVIVK